MEESQAIARLKRGDIGGLAVLVRKYQVQATRTAYLIVRDRALAEDIVQAAFVRTYERIDQFDATRPFAPWFLRSVANDAIKAAQRRERQIPLDAENEDGITLANFLADPTPEPAEFAEHAEMRDAVWAAIGKLAPAQRAAIVLRYFVELSETEMTQELACPRGTIKWRLHQAREHLRRWLHRFHSVEPCSAFQRSTSTLPNSQKEPKP